MDKSSIHQQPCIPFEALYDLIAGHEEWLMVRILEYARRQGYTAYTSTLAEAWRVSICGLSTPLMEALCTHKAVPEFGPGMDYATDPIAAFGVLEARLHRSRGITLDLFLGLMKYYRQSYLDLVDEGRFTLEQREGARLFIGRFFDRIELGFCSEWASHSEPTKLNELQLRNRDLTNEKNKYLTIFESLNDAVFLMDEQHELVNLNEAAARTFTTLETPGALYYSHNDLQIDWLQEQVTVLEQMKQPEARLELELETRRGRRWFELKLKRMLDISAKFTGTVVICSDISERKEAELTLQHAKEQSDEANRAKSTFLATMSHELRTPLNGILGYAQILQRDAHLTTSQQEGLRVIQQCGLHLLNLINEILDLSKIEAHKLELASEAVYLPGFLFAVSEMCRIKAEQKEISYSFEASEDLPAGVYTDEQRLRQVLLNLLSNAVKFTDRGQVRFRVLLLESRHTSLPVYRLRFEVEDTGIGMSETQVKRIFEPFEQVSDSRRQREGTGLGLAITQRLVHLMGGEVYVETAPDKGSRFWFELLLSEAGGALREHPHHYTAAIIGYDGWRRTILVVDDRRENRAVLVHLLGPLGFIMLEAENGQEALELALSRRPDLVITDLVMPVMDGFEMTRQLRRQPDFEHTPIIAMSASVHHIERNRSTEMGCNDFLAKPLQADELLESLARCLSLTWIYRTPERPENDNGSLDGELIRPPAAELALLRNALECGDFEEIERIGHRVEQMGALYRPFAIRLLALAHNFEEQQILAMIEE